MQGVFFVAVRAAVEEVTAARLGRDERRHTRAWKLFPIDSEELAGGDWIVLLEASEGSVEAGAAASARWRKRGGNGDVKRANGALQLVQMEELSAVCRHWRELSWPQERWPRCTLSSILRRGFRCRGAHPQGPYRPAATCVVQLL